jgi:hypothetical protein
MTTSPNKMSDEELKKEILYQPDDIDDLVVWTLPCADCGEVGCPYMYDEDRKELEERLRDLIKQHREAYAIEELEKAFGSGERGGMDNWGRSVNIYLRTRIAELREKVGKL